MKISLFIVLNWWCCTSSAATQQAALLAIARQCPYAGGDAVYRARSLCSAFSDEIYNDKAICNAVGIQARQIKPKATTTENTNIRLYPNPTSGDISIEGITENTNIIIRNLLGQVIFSNNITQNKTTIALSTVPAGTYFVEIKQNDIIVLNTKLVIVKL